MRAIYKPLVATAAVVLAYAGYSVWLTAEGNAKLAESMRPALGTTANFEVVLNFPPEKFHQTRLQSAGRVVKVEGNSVFIMDVQRDQAVALARNYWVQAMRPWKAS